MADEMDPREIGKAIAKLRGCRQSVSASEPARYLRSLEAAVAAKLPADYEILLTKLGPRQIHEVSLYDPGLIPGYVNGIWNLTGCQSNQWPALPVGSVGSSGDDVGYLRDGEAFGSALYQFSHEVSWDDPERGFATKLAESLVHFVLMEKA